MDLGDMVVNIRLRTDALERGLRDAQREIERLQDQMRDQSAQNELNSSLLKIGATAGVVFAGIASAVKSAVAAHNEYTSIMKGFANQLRATGQDINGAMKSVQDIAKDGLVSESDTAAAIKNLVNYGFTVERAEKAVKAIKDTAIDNRQAHYSLSEAVRVTTEGIRMENSELSDAAGIQKNIAKMVEDYAKAIGKKTTELTKSEKAEAIYSGIMEESAANMGRAVEYAEELGGQQAMLDASTQKLAQSFGAALAPAMGQITAVLLPLVQTLTSFVTQYPALTSAITTFIGVAAGLITLLAALRMAFISLTTASAMFNTTLSGMLLNPWVLGLAALAAAVAAITFEIQRSKQATEELRAAEERLQDLRQNGVSKQELETRIAEREALEELISIYERLIDLAQKMAAESGTGNNLLALDTAARKLDTSLEEINKKANDLGLTLEFVSKEGDIAAESNKVLATALEDYNGAIKEAQKLTLLEVNEMAKSTAQKAAAALQTKNLITQYKAAKKGSTEFTQAQSELAKLYPQLSTSTGINVQAIEGLLIVKQREIDLEWRNIQLKAQEALQETKTAIAKQQAAITVAEAIGKIAGASGLAEIALANMNNELARLRGEAANLQALIDGKPTEFGGVAPVAAPKIAAPKVAKQPKQKAYENKALEEAYKQLEHKKRLDQLTLESEIKTLEAIKAKHVKTADERMEIEERLYEARKALGDVALEKALRDYERAKDLGKLSENDEIVRLEAIKKKYADSAAERQQLDDQIYEARKAKIEAEKQAESEAFTEVTEEFRKAVEERLAVEDLSAEQEYQVKRQLYEDLIRENQEYLARVNADSKYSAKERIEIDKSVKDSIRQNRLEMIQMEKQYAAAVKQEQIDSINELSSAVQKALKERYTAEKEAAVQRVKDAQEANEAWKKAQLDAVKDAYESRKKMAEESANAEIEQIERVYNAQIAAIDAELAAMEKAEQQRSRAELDADDELKISRLQGKIEYEHDEFNKAQLQKELQRVMAEQDERHRQEQLQDRKEDLQAQKKELQDSLKERMDQLKAHLAEKKVVEDADYLAEVERINATYESTKTSLDQRMIATQDHYAKLLDAKRIQAEAETMIVQDQQEEIIKLLGEFGDDYKVTGTSLGEQMYNGFKGPVNRIMDLIDELNRKMQKARADAVAAMNSVSAASSSGGSFGSGSSSSSSGGSSSKSSSSSGGGGGSSSKTVNVTNNFSSSNLSPSKIANTIKKTAQNLLK
ncbi:hypothetical protein [Paenibacillus massiliensis]|uniref:hypothetical protein n=1 Tax=Paenibacillus massiliensis TaxID=225917 RepID=UPI00046E781D|nr:hypothetical protein [Paenibacillus massiliensis]